jgi:hypothetical protein
VNGVKNPVLGSQVDGIKIAHFTFIFEKRTELSTRRIPLDKDWTPCVKFLLDHFSIFSQNTPELGSFRRYWTAH